MSALADSYLLIVLVALAVFALAARHIHQQFSPGSTSAGPLDIREDASPRVITAVRQLRMIQSELDIQPELVAQRLDGICRSRGIPTDDIDRHLPSVVQVDLLATRLEHVLGIGGPALSPSAPTTNPPASRTKASDES